MWQSGRDKGRNVGTDLKNIARTLSPAAILFDLDGTLVDSAPDLQASVNRLLARYGQAGQDLECVKNWIGNGVEKLVERALTEALPNQVDPPLLHQAVQQFNALYREENGRSARLFPGVSETLSALAKNVISLLGVVTNKPDAFTKPLLHTLGMLPFFQVIVSGDTVTHKKPHPEPLHYALNTLRIAPDKAVFIGDSAHDIMAGKAAGVTVIGVGYGYNQGIDLRTVSSSGTSALTVLDSLLELETLLT